MICIAYRDLLDCDRAALLPDPRTGRPLVMDPDTALGVARILTEAGVTDVGIVAAPDRSCPHEHVLCCCHDFASASSHPPRPRTGVAGPSR